MSNRVGSVLALAGGCAILGCVAALVASTGGTQRDALAAGPDGPVARASGEQAAGALRQRGAYLWSVGDCIDCHSPKDEKGMPIPTMLMAGHPEKEPLPKWDPSMLKDHVLMTMNPTGTAFAGPWGVSVAPNLTPDKETGIGNMTAEQMVQSFRNIKHWKEDRPIMRPMPAANYGMMSDEDIRAIHAFLMSLPPVKNAAPASRPAPAPTPPAGGAK